MMLLAGRPAVAVVEAGVYRGVFTLDRLVHVHHYVLQRGSVQERYRSIAHALGLSGRT
mgnify:FL=1